MTKFLTIADILYLLPPNRHFVVYYNDLNHEDFSHCIAYSGSWEDLPFADIFFSEILQIDFEGNVVFIFLL